MIYVYTCIIDGFDNVRPPAVPAEDTVRYICFTNIPNLPRVYPWEYRPIYDVGNPSRTSRVPKILPHLMLPEDAEYSIYHDGNFQLRQSAHQMIDILDDEHQWAAHAHPGRNCIYDEAQILIRERIGTRELVEADVARYRAAGFPEKAGLWANGMLVRRHTPEVASLNELWWEFYSRGCERDQISFPPALARSKVRVRTIQQNIFSSSCVVFRWHAAWRKKEDNPDFWSQRDSIRGRLSRLAEITGTTGGVRHIAE